MMLLGYKTSSGTLGKDLDHWNTEDLNGNLPFQWSNTVLGGYENITTIELINRYGWTGGKDFKFVRDQIKAIVVAAGDGNEHDGFDALTSDQKVIVSGLKIGTASQRLAVMGMEDLVAAMIVYKSKTVEARNNRATRGEVILRNYLPNNTAEVLAVADTTFKNYLIYGIDGIEQGDTVPGISDYINAINGFEGVGLRDQTVTPASGTLDGLCDLLIDVMINGIY